MRVRGSVVTPTGIVSDGTIEIVDGHIAEIVENDPSDGLPEPGDTEGADLAAAWVLPGFVDIHMHGGGGASFTSGDADEAVLAPGEELEDLGEGVVSITDLLVEPRWQRRGHGSRLLAASADLWRDDGFTTALAWAFDADVAMLRFLESAGWALDGATRALDVDDLLVPQSRLHVGMA